MLAWPEYTSYPILFYLGDYVKIGCVLTQPTPLPMDQVEKLERAGAPLLMDRHWPDWIVFFGIHPDCEAVLARFSRPHAQGDKIVQMTYKTVAILDVYWFATFRPELHLHTFGPDRVFDPATSGVHILKRTLVSSAPSPPPTTRPAD